MEAFFISAGVVALAEVGDKTQLLALVLAARFRKPIPIILGILAATLVNHALAGLVGGWLSSTVGPNVMRWILGVSFIAMAIWTLIPDKYEEQAAKAPRFGVFGTTLIAFFLLEMGDKTANRNGRTRGRVLVHRGGRCRHDSWDDACQRASRAARRSRGEKVAPDTGARHRCSVVPGVGSGRAVRAKHWAPLKARKIVRPRFPHDTNCRAKKEHGND
jgi:hypothetical protein